MKGKNLLKVAGIFALGILGSGSAWAQAPLKENIGGNLGGTRFVVTKPAVVKGVKKISYATWAPAASPVISNVPVEKAYDTLGAGPLLNGTGSYPTLNGKFALIFRGGGINFSDKVKACVSAGARGVIVVNNVPGDPMAMGAVPATYVSPIPVLMVTDVEGLAINNSIKTNPSDTVKITLGTWNTGGTHDLGIITEYISLPHAVNIPISQFTGTSVYNNHYPAAAVANYGKVTEKNVVVTDSVFWTAKGASTRSFVTRNSFTIDSISVADSIKFGFGALYTIASPATAGKYDHQYSLAYSVADEFPEDNIATRSHFVTDSVFSKSVLNPITGTVRSNSGYGPADAATGSTLAGLVGNVLYVKNADLTNNKYSQYILSQKDKDILGSTGDILFSHLFKWSDGTGGDLDSFVQAGELVEVGISAYELSSKDSNGHVLTSKFLNFADPDNPTAKVALDANSWYVQMIEVPATFYLGYDESISTFTRAYGQFVSGGKKPGSAIADRDEAALFTTFSDAFSDPATTFVNYPFGAVAASVPATSNFFVDSIFYDRYDKVPSIAMITTPNTIVTGPGSSIAENKKAAGVMNVFPVPAANMVTVTLNLDNVSKSVTVRLFDAMGRTVFADKRMDVKSDKFDIDLSKMAAGNYYLVAVTANGMLTKAITVAK